MTLAKVAELAEDYRTMQTYVRRAIELRVMAHSSTRDRRKSQNTPNNTTLQNREEDEVSEVRKISLNLYYLAFINRIQTGRARLDPGGLHEEEATAQRCHRVC